mgnify:FL=1
MNGAPGQAAPISYSSLNVCTNTSSDFSVPTVTGASSYNWTLSGGGTITTGQGSKNITVQWAGTPLSNQILQLVTTNACGTSPVRGANGINITNCAKFENESALFNLNMFPNPANGQVSVQFSANESSEYRMIITDVIGRTMFFKEGIATPGENLQQINIEHFSDGVYHLSVEMNGMKEQLILMVN